MADHHLPNVLLECANEYAAIKAERRRLQNSRDGVRREAYMERLQQQEILIMLRASHGGFTMQEVARIAQGS